MSNSENSKRIAKNTFVLYFRMLFLMIIALYTSRVILDALGVDDYGIYNVVAGFVLMFNLISSALSGASSRFLNYEMGKNNPQRLSLVFSTTVIIQWSLAFIVFILAELIGVWYVNNIMVIPIERITAANWCFQLSVLDFCVTLITVPYNACIIAHEDMKTFAYVSIFEGIAKLGISLLVYVALFDGLIFYAISLFLVKLTVCLCYQIFCKRHYIECTFRMRYDQPLLMHMLSYSVWHLIGNGAGVLKTHGVNVVLNLFFGPSVNAARGIATQVEGAVGQFAGNFMMAMNPQITKSYANNDYDYMFKLVRSGSRFSYYLMAMISFPIVINCHYILSVWLTRVPDYTVIFTQLTLICALIATITKPLVTAQNATGNVRNYQIIVGGVLLLNLPLSYIFLKLGFSPEIVIIVAILVELFVLLTRIIMVKYTIKEFSRLDYLKNVCLNCLFVSIVSLLIPSLYRYFVDETIFSFIISCLLTVVSSALCIYFIGCDKSEREHLFVYIKKIIKK